MFRGIPTFVPLHWSGEKSSWIVGILAQFHFRSIFLRIRGFGCGRFCQMGVVDFVRWVWPKVCA